MAVSMLSKHGHGQFAAYANLDSKSIDLLYIESRTLEIPDGRKASNVPRWWNSIGNHDCPKYLDYPTNHHRNTECKARSQVRGASKIAQLRCAYIKKAGFGDSRPENGGVMPEYIMTVSIEYGTNIEADSAEQARDKARSLINEANVNWLCDIADITIEGE